MQTLQSSESSLRRFSLLGDRRAIGNLKCESDEPLGGYDTALDPRPELLESLQVLRNEKERVRKACIVAGHSVREIDALMANGILEQPHQEQGTHLTTIPNHQGMFSIRKHTQDSRLLDGWSTTRDRINSWLLQTLRSDERQAHLHRSMLAEPETDDDVWARNVLRHWNLDEAATGVDLIASESVGADSSRDQSQSELVGFLDVQRQSTAEGSLAITVVPLEGRDFKTIFSMAIHLPDGARAQRITYLDTGSDVDLIALQVVEELELHKEKYQGPCLHPLGGVFMPEWQVTFEWHIPKFQRKTYRMTFAVMDEQHSDAFDVLLGHMTICKIRFFERCSQIW